MSYGSSRAVQEAVFAVLTADATVAALSGGAVHDALPTGPVPALYVMLGPEQVRDRSDKTSSAALHDLSVRVISDGAGFADAKALAAAVSEALDGADLVLSYGKLVDLRFHRARARRAGETRDIELWFRALVDLDAV